VAGIGQQLHRRGIRAIHQELVPKVLAPVRDQVGDRAWRTRFRCLPAAARRNHRDARTLFFSCSNSAEVMTPRCLRSANVASWSAELPGDPVAC
jgi:hypothetical protein